MQQTTIVTIANNEANSTCIFLGVKDETMIQLNHEKAIILIPVMVFLILLMIIGTLGNALVIYVYQFRFKKTPSNRFILWMAVLDLFSCVIGVPFEIFDLSRPYTFDMPWGCKFLRFVSSTAVITSSLVLIAVAFDRYFKAFKPFKRLTIRSTNIYNGLALLIGILLSTPSMWIFGLKSTEIEHKGRCLIGKGCSADDAMKGKPFSYAYYGILLLVYIVLIAFQIVLYGKLGKEILRRKKANAKRDVSKIVSHTTEPESTSFLNQDDVVEGRVKNSTGKSSHSGTSTLKKKIDRAAGKVRIGRTTLIFFCVSVAFIASFLPHIISKILQATIKNFDNFTSDGSEIAYNFFSRTQFINNAINPVIYGFLNPNFRVHCVQIMAAMCGRKEPPVMKTDHNAQQRKMSNVSQSC